MQRTLLDSDEASNLESMQVTLADGNLLELDEGPRRRTARSR